MIVERRQSHDIEVAYMGNDPYFGYSYSEVPSDQSYRRHLFIQICLLITQISENTITMGTKDHHLNNIIVNSLDQFFHKGCNYMSQALFVTTDAFLTDVEPKTYKDALTQACWMEANAEELNEYSKRLLKYGSSYPRPGILPMVRNPTGEDKEREAVDSPHFVGTVNRGTMVSMDSSIASKAFPGCGFAVQKSAAISSTEDEYIALSAVISADVPEIYMQEFWVTVTRHHSSLRFKLDGKSHTVNVDNFRDMLKICPKLPSQKFEEPLLEEDILSFIRDLGHTSEIKFLSDVNVNHMH
ncbi:hypothetical protein Tco_0773222 [Tanacetum coccineum]|uniref:Uncharacterized protein n=1 Tax=Tanacetum coccineum TaxID=301880 RepID=A0ABQ4ZMQ8_9ASTR